MLIHSDSSNTNDLFFLLFFFAAKIILFQHRVQLFLLTTYIFNFACFWVIIIVPLYMFIFHLTFLVIQDNLHLLCFGRVHSLKPYIDYLQVIELSIQVFFFIINIFYIHFINLLIQYFYFLITYLVDFVSKFLSIELHSIFYLPLIRVNCIFFTLFIVSHGLLVSSIIILIDIIFVVEFV
jgi:hypothetical protein